jgi:hypothetical protein
MRDDEMPRQSGRYKHHHYYTRKKFGSTLDVKNAMFMRGLGKWGYTLEKNRIWIPASHVFNGTSWMDYKANYNKVAVGIEPNLLRKIGRFFQECGEVTVKAA